MKKIILLFLSLIFTNSLALSPYIGSYQLYADTKMGNLQIGSAVLNLEMNDSEFVFTTEAKTESLWKALYDYSRSEKSAGNETDGQVINKYFSVIEKIKDEVRKDYEITLLLIKIMHYQAQVRNLKSSLAFLLIRLVFILRYQMICLIIQINQNLPTK